MSNDEEYWTERALAAEAELKRLRAVVERAHDDVAVDERVLRTLDLDGLVALIGVLRRDYREAAAERDRLRTELDAIGQHDSTGEDHLREMVEHAERADVAEAERDRLRAVVVIVRADRDRLRIVAEAAHELLDEDRTSWSPEHARLAEALAALDVSGDMGGHEEEDDGRQDRAADQELGEEPPVVGSTSAVGDVGRPHDRVVDDPDDPGHALGDAGHQDEDSAGGRVTPPVDRGAGGCDSGAPPADAGDPFTHLALDGVQALIAERDRLRAVVEAIAKIPPGGTTLLSPPTVTDLQTVARNALAQLDTTGVIGGDEGGPSDG